MADQQQTAAQLAAKRAAANMNFLANSYPDQKKMNAQNTTVYTPGAQLAFTAPILPGWAKFMRIFYNLQVTIALGGGTATLNAGAPYNMFSNVGVDFSGQNHRSHSGYFLKVLQQSYRGLLDLDAAKAFANSLISTELPLATGVNNWVGYMDVPMQIEEGDVAGMIPIGESATPLTLRLTCAPQFAGADPFTNVINLAGGATLTSVTGTVTAAVEYRYGQSAHSPQIRPETPFIGSFAKIVESVTVIGQNQTYVATELRQPYPHLKVMQIAVIPVLPTRFCDAAQVGGLLFKLDPSTTMHDYSEAGMTAKGKLVEQRLRYHGDLDEGVYAWDFLAGSMPEVPNGLNTPNIGAYNAAQTEILYNGPLVGVNDRIVTAAMFLEELPY
jgi:hypothetical protein